MGAFKEIYSEQFDEAYFQDLDINLDGLVVELEDLDRQLEFIDLECAQVLKQAELLLPQF
ncbi:MAG: hypothetical protein HUU57_15425 [Bdellovibrio sp.]|nr:hypothetical protein [Bdellovibrio sp.]